MDLWFIIVVYTLQTEKKFKIDKVGGSYEKKDQGKDYDWFIGGGDDVHVGAGDGVCG